MNEVLKNRDHTQARFNGDIGYRDALGTQERIIRCVGCSQDFVAVYPKSWDDSRLVTRLKSDYPDCTTHPKSAFETLYITETKGREILAQEIEESEVGGKRKRGRPRKIKNKQD